MITIENTRTTKDGIYVGRAMPGLKGSPLGNPFKLTKHTSREAVIERYREWLGYQSMHDDAVMAELQRLIDIARKGDLTLLCWCAPEACHADVIKAYIEDMLSGKPKYDVLRYDVLGWVCLLSDSKSRGCIHHAADMAIHIQWTGR